MMTWLMSLPRRVREWLVWIGVGTVGLLLVVLDSFRAGKRAAERREVADKLKEEGHAIDEMAHAPDAGDRLHDDILKRVDSPRR